MKQFMAILAAVGFVLGAMGGAHEAAGAMVISQASSAPTADVVVSQTNEDSNVQFNWGRPAGTDRQPRDAGQTFSYPTDLDLDKVTVNLARLSTSDYNGDPVTLAIYPFTNNADFQPDGAAIFSEGGNLPSDMRADYDSGNVYLTFDIDDVTLGGGSQYGFLLMHDQQNGNGAEDDMRLAAKMNSLFTDGTGIIRERRTTGGDNYQAMMLWDGQQGQPGDLEFYLQETPAGAVIPEPSTIVIWALGLLALGWYGWRKRFRI